MKNEKIKSRDLVKSKKFDTFQFSKKKIGTFQNMITHTILAVQRYKIQDIFGASELNVCIQGLEGLYSELKILQTMLGNEDSTIDFDEVISRLQRINNELSVIFRSYGTESIEDLISVAMGAEFVKDTIAEEDRDKYELIRKYVHPIGYKVMAWKEGDNKNIKKLAKNRIVEDFMIVANATNLECFDLARTSRKFNTKVHGIKVTVKNSSEKKTLIVSGLVDDIIVSCSNYDFLKERLATLTSKKPNDPEFQSQDFARFVETLTIKELLIYGNNELYQRFVGYLNQVNLIKQKPISQNVKEFISCELYGQRRTLIQLLMKNNDPEFQYLAYLLYDLLSNDANGSVDTVEQTILFDSLPWTIKKFFRDAMKNTMKYTKDLSNFDSSKIPIEQQICLLKAPDNVKEKAMLKMKEVKAKSEDSGSKARQYLDGLLKIPFGIYRTEYILTVMGDIRQSFLSIVSIVSKKQNHTKSGAIVIKKKYTCVEVCQYIRMLEDTYLDELKDSHLKRLISYFCKGKRDTLVANICYINGIIKKRNIKHSKLCHSGKKNNYMKQHMTNFLKSVNDDDAISIDMQKRFSKYFNSSVRQNLLKELGNIKGKWQEINETISLIHTTLDEAIHGHDKAKRQIERIIGQWINGEQTGYCFGFEGPPGVGKTSLAKKGLAKCLLDRNDGTYRPFAFIPIGGSCNGSTLSGHNYTYVGSTWGRIVDILMETKCMNPIIFIDELDKVSRSEHGKEIIGILTHLVDSAQNESFQDKYFNGVDLDLSKVLFIFSYNDPAVIDKILLDRIHRVEFSHLSLKEKVVIARKYILPEIYTKIGLQDVIQLDDDVVKFIIERYTYEPGVRKLKEILFEIISEINLSILQNPEYKMELPIVLTTDEVKSKYLKERQEVVYAQVHESACVGIMNGLWANSLGKGGLIPIECYYYPAHNFLDLKLTGLQGDVMKESMNVAKTLAWKLTKKTVQKKIVATMEKDKMKGIHIHCPEGATPKDGPSAGTAITVAIYSLLNKKKIKNTIAITGEINLQGRVTRIGGLELKILGGIRAGIKEFVLPKTNDQDLQTFLEKYGDSDSVKVIKFHKVSGIRDVLKLVFVK